MKLDVIIDVTITVRNAVVIIEYRINNRLTFDVNFLNSQAIIILDTT
jgi:hypothetical protein